MTCARPTIACTAGYVHELLVREPCARWFDMLTHAYQCGDTDRRRELTSQGTDKGTKQTWASLPNLEIVRQNRRTLA
eukprot:scaffold67198_cov50-Attheya_sp.AAC.8